jgi:hypothetical protein
MKRKLLVRCGERWGEIHRCKAAGTPSFDAMVLWQFLALVAVGCRALLVFGPIFEECWP